MVWVEVHQSLINHRKTLNAADLLDMAPVHVVGHLTAFWLWCLDNAPPDGVLAGVSPRMIAGAACWPGKPSDLVAALLAAGFLQEENGVLAVHDWYDYGGKMTEAREEERQRSRRRRAEARAEETTAGRPPDDRRTTAGRVEKSREQKNRLHAAAARTRAGDESEHDATTTVDADGPEQELLAALGAAATPANVRAVAAVVSAYPALDHRQQTAVCAAYYADHKRAPPNVAKYAEWCKRDRGEGTNGAHQQAAGGAGAGRHRRAGPGDPPPPVNEQHAAHARSITW